MFEIKECKTKAAFEAKPTKNLKLDLKRIKSKHKTLFDSPIALVIKIDDCEVIVHKHGGLLFKDCKDKKKLEKIAKKIYDEGLLRQG